MDRRERYFDPEETLRLAMTAHQTRLWTALPGIVQEVNAAQMTANVQPAVNGRMPNPDGSTSGWKMPKLLDCPLVWMGGGGMTFTFPVKPGDECLVVFAARCIDGWWQQGKVCDPPDVRMHNLSDGFAIVGLRSLPRVWSLDTAAACLRSDDNSAYLKFNPTTRALAVLAPGGISLNGVTIDASGNLTSPATITGNTDVIAGTRSGKTHTHNDPQGGVTGQPN